MKKVCIAEDKQLSLYYVGVCGFSLCDLAVKNILVIKC